ncbi:MAG: hypothetical protein WCA27_22465 [Candidatus Sulfotelmatobacter sp.]
MRKILSVLFVLLASVAVFATTLVGLRQKDLFVIGADSKATYRGKGIKGPETVCKIYQAGRVYFAISGLADDRNTNFFPGKIVANSFSDNAASFNSNLQHMERALSDSLATEMTRLKARDRDAFDQTQKDEGDTVAVLAAEMEGDHPVMGGAGFRYVDGTAPSIVVHGSICPGDCPGDKDGVFYGGHYESAQKMAMEFYKSHRTVTRPTKFVRGLVEAEIRSSSEEVGPPITILRVDKSGPHWILNDSGCPIVVVPGQ